MREHCPKHGEVLAVPDPPKRGGVLMSDATYYDGLAQGETYERTRVIAYLQREAETYRRVSGPHQTEPLDTTIRRLVEAIENDRHWAEDSESNHA